MKKIILLFLCIILASIYADARMTVTQVGSMPSIAPASVLKDSSSITPGSSRYFGYNTYSRVVGAVNPTSTYTVTSVKLAPGKVGSGGSCTVYAVIYNSARDTVLATSTDTRSSSTFDGTLLEWSFAGYEVTGSTLYYMGLDATSGSCGWAGNYPNLPYLNSGSRGIYYFGSSWALEDSSADFNFEVYGY